MAKARRLDAQAVKTILSLVRMGRGITTAARFAGVSRQAIYKRMDSSKKFREDIEEAKAYAFDCVEGAFWDLATGNPPGPGKKAANVLAAIYYLKNRDPKNWCDKRDVEHSEELTLAQIVAHADKLDAAEAAKKAAEKAKKAA